MGQSRYLIVTALISLLLLGGCKEQPPPEPVFPKRPLTFGMVPFHALPELYAESKIIASYLSERLDRKIRFVLMPDYASITKLLLHEQLDVAWMTPMPYAKVRSRIDYEILCAPSRRGRHSHRGVIVTKRDSPYKTLQDLKGCTFAYVDRYSTSGFVFPNLLFQENGIDPLAFFGAVHFSHTHSSSLLGVIEGRYDAAAVYDQAYLTSLSKEDRRKLKALAFTKTIPADPIVIRKNLDDGLKAKLKELFLHMKRLGPETLQSLTDRDGIDEFFETTESAYDIPQLSSSSSTNDR